jgi:hypothetical protein
MRGWVYILGSESEQLLKFGISENLGQRFRQNKTQKYGGISDWKLLYYVITDNAGSKETEALRLLSEHKVVREYWKGGTEPQKTRELVSCDFTVALRTLEECLTETERTKAWQSADSYLYEFSVQRRKEFQELYRRKCPRAPIGMPVRSLLFMKIANLDLSARSTRCLLNDGVAHLGTLIGKSSEEILRTPNTGRKSLTEIESLLKDYELSLGTTLLNWPPRNLDMLADSIEPFLMRLDDCEFSARVMTILRHADILYVGELVQHSEQQMLQHPQMGRKSLNELIQFLSGMNLKFGMDLSRDLDFAI